MKNIIITIVITVVVMVTAFLGYTFYQQINLNNQQSAAITQQNTIIQQIVTFINQHSANAVQTTNK